MRAYIHLGYAVLTGLTSRTIATTHGLVERNTSSNTVVKPYWPWDLDDVRPLTMIATVNSSYEQVLVPEDTLKWVGYPSMRFAAYDSWPFSGGQGKEGYFFVNGTTHATSLNILGTTPAASGGRPLCNRDHIVEHAASLWRLDVHEDGDFMNFAWHNISDQQFVWNYSAEGELSAPDRHSRASEASGFLLCWESCNATYYDPCRRYLAWGKYNESSSSSPGKCLNAKVRLDPVPAENVTTTPCHST